MFCRNLLKITLGGVILGAVSIKYVRTVLWIEHKFRKTLLENGIRLFLYTFLYMSGKLLRKLR